jgi:alkylhydroperoxidase family enzyme
MKALSAPLVSCIVVMAVGTSVATPDNVGAFTPRLTVPRLAPLARANATPEQQQMLANDNNIYTTLAHHVDLFNRWSPLTQFLLNGSSLPPREREMVMLRMGWLCQAEYEWSQHARIAQGAPGLTAQDIHRIAVGPEAPDWSDFDRTLLRMVDELRYDAIVSDTTWKGLRAKYSVQQVMESVYTAAQYQLVSMAINSLGVQLDPMLNDRLPTDVVKPRPAGMTQAPRLKAPRLEPVPEAQWTGEQRKLIEPQIVEGKVMNLYATLLNHPGLYGPRRIFGRYLQREASLPAQTRELLIMRTSWLIRSEYEWVHHAKLARSAGLTDADIQRIAAGPAAPGWNEEQRAVLQAADELRREAFVSDRTWAVLSKHYDTRQLIEIVYTVGGYTMTGLAINSFGIQIEPGLAAVPMK